MVGRRQLTGMRFSLTAEQQEFRLAVREFAAQHITPRAGELDRTGAYPADVFAELGERRYTGLTLSADHDGLGGGAIEYVLLIEELAAAMTPIAGALALHLDCAMVVEHHGSEALKQEILPAAARFETVLALGLTERSAGSDVRAMKTTAERDGDGWLLSGQKRWVTNFFEADYVLTYARTGDDGDGYTAFLVPAAKFEVETDWETLGGRITPSPAVSLSDVRVPAEHMIGTVGAGLDQRRDLPIGVNYPARGVGVARASLDDAITYAKRREQSGQPIASFQGIRWRLAEMAQRVDTARLLTWRMADLADRGHDIRYERSMAKVYATQAAVDNANDAFQIHGGIGYTTAANVERYIREARLLTVAGGPNEVHLDRVADALVADSGEHGAEG